MLIGETKATKSDGCMPMFKVIRLETRMLNPHFSSSFYVALCSFNCRIWGLDVCYDLPSE